MSKKEIWKDVAGYDGKYQVSNFGRIKNNKIILKNVLKRIGYLQISLHKKGVQKICLVHRLVAKAFIPNPFNKPQINHKDGNGTNNNVENLEWCNASENGLHSYRVLGNKAWQKGKTGEHTPTSRPVLQKTLDGKLVKRWGCGLDAVREGGFDSSCIARCCSGENKKHKGFIWEYEQQK